MFAVLPADGKRHGQLKRDVLDEMQLYIIQALASFPALSPLPLIL